MPIRQWFFLCVGTTSDVLITFSLVGAVEIPPIGNSQILNAPVAICVALRVHLWFILTVGIHMRDFVIATSVRMVEILSLHMRFTESI